MVGAKVTVPLGITTTLVCRAWPLRSLMRTVSVALLTVNGVFVSGHWPGVV